MQSDHDLLVRIIQTCAHLAPQPFFPSRFAVDAGVDRTRLDAAVDQLRLNGHIEIVDWVPGLGQGYLLTAAGRAALDDPRRLAQPARRPAPEESSFSSARPWEATDRILEALLNPRWPAATLIVLLGNLVMYGVGLAWAARHGVGIDAYLTGGQGTAPLLHSLGGLTPFDVVVRHQWWRLVAYQFLHVSGLHLLMNCFCLGMLGRLGEAIFGWSRFVVIFVISGVVGGAAVVATGRPNVVVAGASGSLSGLLTALGSWLWLNRDRLPDNLWSALLSRVGANLMLLVLISLIPGVAWHAHLGGALGGALAAIAVHATMSRPRWTKTLAWLAVVAVPIVSAYLAYEFRLRRLPPALPQGALSRPCSVAQVPDRPSANSSSAQASSVAARTIVAFPGDQPPPPGRS
ncbi:MAG: rhomboid family intramembrane serine protease [Gemmataceae bacterium]|nr:rhomboid family intramembrane serine protease [Gemmataceae bacterium]